MTTQAEIQKIAKQLQERPEIADLIAMILDQPEAKQEQLINAAMHQLRHNLN